MENSNVLFNEYLKRERAGYKFNFYTGAISLLAIFSILFIISTCESLGAQKILNTNVQNRVSKDIQNKVIKQKGHLEIQVASILNKSKGLNTLSVREVEYR